MNDAMFNHAVAVAKKKDGTGSCYLVCRFGVLWKGMIHKISGIMYKRLMGQRCFKNPILPTKRYSLRIKVFLKKRWTPNYLLTLLL